MATTPLPLPTPGQSNWAAPLNASLEQLNQEIGTVDDAAEAAQASANLAAQYAAQAGEAQDGAIADILSDNDSDSRAVLNTAYTNLSQTRIQSLGGNAGVDPKFDALRFGIINPTTDYRVVVLGSSSSNGAYTTEPEKAVFQRLAYMSGVSSYPSLDAVASPVAVGPMRWWTGSEGNTTSANYFPTARRNALANVKPDLVIHMVGENDYFYKTTIANYKANLENALQFVESQSPTVINVLVHSHGRYDVTSPVASWDQYGAAMKEVADALPGRRYFLNTMDYFYPLGTMGDNLGGMIMGGSDNVHPNDAGHHYLAKIIGSHLGIPNADDFATTQTWKFPLPATATNYTTTGAVIAELYLTAVKYPREMTLTGGLWATVSNASGYIQANFLNTDTSSLISGHAMKGISGALTIPLNTSFYIPPRIKPRIQLIAFPESGTVTVQGEPAGNGASLSRAKLISSPI